MFYVSIFINSIIVFIFSYYALMVFISKKRIITRLEISSNKKIAKTNKIKQAKTMIKNNSMMEPNSLNNKLQSKLLGSGVTMKVSTFIAAFFITLIVLLLIAVFLVKSLLLALIFIIFTPVLVNMILNKLKNNRLNKIQSQLLDMTLTLTSNLKSGYSLVQGLSSIVKEGLDPLASELDLFLKDISIGLSYDEASDKLLKKNPIEDLEILMTGIIINKENGGSLSYLLETITETIRERERVHGEVKSLTAQGRLSGLILSLMPVGIAVLLYIINPSYMTPLFSHPLGKVLLAFGVTGELIGILLIKKITKIDW
jgi:tight adherence protein B